MKICVPTKNNNGLQSEVSDHFGSAPFFLIVDTSTAQCEVITNENQHHSHGMCQPLQTIGGYDFEGIVVRGIGQGALNKLLSAGKRVLISETTTVQALVDEVIAGQCRDIDPSHSCGHHGGCHDHE
ncbi:MAG: NifB/NifX family molybdenum-iron cluster-binding protein [Deltaproteobacteria bacterium]|nr:NifB/NifX family molybdenum-iron cluster-binding protein [Deltaproteobacteria bacterium]